MKILVERFKIGPNETFGKLFIDGKLFCYTIEDVVRQKEVKIKGRTAIPEGTYKVGLRYSPKFSPVYGHQMLWVLNVPNYEFILIHPGNTHRDTEGCLLVGNAIGILKGIPAILNSKATYFKIYKILAPLARSGDLTITYTNSF